MNYKIKVNSEAESKEVQGLFFELGYKWPTCEKNINTCVSVDDWIFTMLDKNLINYGIGYGIEKEITLPELRDLVVLKRNSIDDATHVDRDGEPWFASSDNKFHSWADDHWAQERKNVVSNYNPKPIEKPMKEYLNKETYEFIRSHSELNDMWIEIPRGANFAAFNQALNNYYFNEENIYIPDYVIWQRHPEETLNDKVASAETARQANKVLKEILEGDGSAWDTQVGGDHYKKYKIQPMEFALKNNLNPLQHSVLKYVMRHEDKNGKQDLEKAKHYIDLMIEYYYGNP